MKKYFLAATMFGGFLATAPALADSLEEDAAVFGMREAVLDISLSPSGNKIA